MSPDLVNLYIEKLLSEISEATKYRIFVETKLKYTENLNADLNKKLKALEAQVEKQGNNKNKKSSGGTNASSPAMKSSEEF